MKTAWVVLLYGICVLVGGIMGHVKAGSFASLLSGIISGSLLLAASWMCFKKKAAGYIFALIVSLLLEGFFIWRFVKTQNFVPAGILSLATIFVILILAYKVFKRKRQ